MNAHRILDDAARDRAALYALSGMDADEARAYEAHLTTCSLCRTEVQALRQLSGDLGLAAPPARLDPALKERLFRRIHEDAAPKAPLQIWKTWRGTDAPGLTFVPAGEGGWERTAIPGIEVRKLHVDEPNDRVTMLVRMAPGTSYPAHRHGGPEECFVIAGDLRVGEMEMRAGDYQRAANASDHVVQSTVGGCLLFIVSSLHDELHPD